MTTTTTSIRVPGTGLTVTFDDESYAGQVVYLHETGQGYWTGERIGTLGGMVGHGVYATLGEPETYGGNVRAENVRAWFTGHMSRDAAAIGMAREHLAIQHDDDFYASVKWGKRS